MLGLHLSRFTLLFHVVLLLLLRSLPPLFRLWAPALGSGQVDGDGSGKGLSEEMAQPLY